MSNLASNLSGPRSTLRVAWWPMYAFVTVYVATSVIGIGILLLHLEPFTTYYEDLSGVVAPNLDVRETGHVLLLTFGGPLLLLAGYRLGLGLVWLRDAEHAGVASRTDAVRIAALALVFIGAAWLLVRLVSAGVASDLGAWFLYDELIDARYRVFGTLGFFEFALAYTVLPLLIGITALRVSRPWRVLWWIGACLTLSVAVMLYQKKALVVSLLLMTLPWLTMRFRYALNRPANHRSRRFILLFMGLVVIYQIAAIAPIFVGNYRSLNEIRDISVVLAEALGIDVELVNDLFTPTPPSLYGICTDGICWRRQGGEVDVLDGGGLRIAAGPTDGYLIASTLMCTYAQRDLITFSGRVSGSRMNLGVLNSTGAWESTRWVGPGEFVEKLVVERPAGDGLYALVVTNVDSNAAAMELRTITISDFAGDDQIPWSRQTPIGNLVWRINAGVEMQTDISRSETTFAFGGNEAQQLVTDPIPVIAGHQPVLRIAGTVVSGAVNFWILDVENTELREGRSELDGPFDLEFRPRSDGKFWAMFYNTDRTRSTLLVLRKTTLDWDPPLPHPEPSSETISPVTLAQTQDVLSELEWDRLGVEERRFHEPGLLAYSILAPLMRTSAPAIAYVQTFPDSHPFFGLDLGEDILGFGAMPDDNRVVWDRMNPQMRGSGATSAPFVFVLYSQVGTVGALLGSGILGFLIATAWAGAWRYHGDAQLRAGLLTLLLLFSVYLALDAPRNALLSSYGVVWGALVIAMLALVVRFTATTSGRTDRSR